MEKSLNFVSMFVCEPSTLHIRHDTRLHQRRTETLAVGAVKA